MIYLIKRYGLWRRGEGLGYTRDIAAAGHFTKDEAESVAGAECVTIHPVSDLVEQLIACRTRYYGHIANINTLLESAYG